MTRIRLVKKTFFAANRVMILFVIFVALLEQCLASSLGSKCQHDMDCTDFIKGSTCSMNGYCECAPYFVQYNVTTCLSSQLLGGDCTLADQCTMKVANSSCLDGACRCVEGFLQFRKHTCLGPAHPGAVCYSHAHCQMNDKRSHCDFLIPNLFGRCQCTSPAKQYGGMCIADDSSVEADVVLSRTTTYAPLITPPPTVFRPIDLISHYELSTQGKPLLVNNDEIINQPSSTENQVEFTKLPEFSVSSSSEQAGGEDLTADTEALDILNTYFTTSSTPGMEAEVAQQAITSDDYPYKIDIEEPTSINEEDTEQVEENPHVPVVSADEVVITPHEETNEITKLESDILVHEDTELEQKPNEDVQTAQKPEIQPEETVTLANIEQESNEHQHSEVEEGKPADELQPEQETATEISAEVEQKTEAIQQNEEDVNSVVSEEKPEENLEISNAPEQGLDATSTIGPLQHISEEVEEHEDSPEKTELQDNINQSEELSSSQEKTEENINLPEQYKEEETQTEQVAELDNIQTSKPIEESVEQELPHGENLSSPLPESELVEEHVSQTNQEISEPLNLESQEESDNNIVQNHLKQPIEMNYDLEQEHSEFNSDEKDKNTLEEQTASTGGQMEESHYRPSSDVHGQEEGTIVDEEVEAHTEANLDSTLTSSQEHVEDELEISSNVEKESEDIETNNEEGEKVSVVDIHQTGQESLGLPALDEEVVQDKIEEHIQEEAPQEPNSEQSIDEDQKEAVQEENLDEQVPQVASSEKSVEEIEAEVAAITESIQEIVPHESIVEQSNEEANVAEETVHEENIQEQVPQKPIPEQLTEEEKITEEEITDKPHENEDPENTPTEQPISEEIKKDDIFEIIEEDSQTVSEEDNKVNTVDQEQSNSDISEGVDLAEAHEQTHASTQEQDQQIAIEDQQEVAHPPTAVQETIEELLQEAAQALAEKDAEEQNKEEMQSLTEKPVLENEDEGLQTLQEETIQLAALDDLIYLPENPSVASEEKEESKPQSNEKESDSKVQINPIIEGEIPEINTEAVETESLPESLSEKVIQISSDEVQDQTQQIDQSTESILQNEPLEALPAEVVTEEVFNKDSDQEVVEKEIVPITLQDLLQGGSQEVLQNNVQNSAEASEAESEIPQYNQETQEAEHATESFVNAEISKLDEHEIESKPDLTASIGVPQGISSDEAISHENQLLESEETPIAPEKDEDTKETVLENESSNETIQQVHDLENIIEGAEPSNDANDNNLVSSVETLPSKIPTETVETNSGDETLALDENPISSNENTISESIEKTESDNTLGVHPINEVKEIDTEVKKIKEDNDGILENDEATTVRSESEQNSDHEPLVHPTFELEETQEAMENVHANVNDKTPTDTIEEANETQTGANANESEPDTTEYVPLAAAESETLATPVADVEPEFSEIEKFEQFEDHHLINEHTEVDNDNEDNLAEEAAVTTNSPILELQSSPIASEESIDNDLKASGDASDFNENESVLSILSGLLENDEEGSGGTPQPSSSIDDLKAEETVHSEQTPATGSYYPSVLSDLLLSTKAEEQSDNKLTTSGPQSDKQEDEEIAPEELPFDLSFVSPSDHEELMSDNLVVETTPGFASESSSEESVTTEVPDILEITTQTMLGLASRVTLMEPAAPVATTLKPFMTMDEDFSTTSSSMNIDSLITSKPVRKRVELGNGPVSLGLSCNNDKQCQLADPNTVCSDQGICDCASKTAAKCSAERTGCSAGTFQCRSSGVCISWFFVCDGRPDCTDASDEECTFNARLNQTCPTESFRCEHSGRCISRAALCDGKKQCPHGEDEIECDSLRTEGGQCPPHTFRCNSGECLPEYEYCNAIISCKDGSDEPPHLCGSRSVPNIFLRLLTAAVVDDGASAKNSRSGINAYCPHRCSNGRCRSTAIVCSGRDGCGDGTDEETCSVCRCPAPAHASTPAEILAQQPSMPLWK
ncbi:titin [Eupeodes corollae]|uniref:titin n=1 Tax=Eupeodes corollae TaxID=290404 RepID=UPI0024919349|nr:titin [Eupeodes corollae]